jgi:hypothetical protein
MKLWAYTESKALSWTFPIKRNDDRSLAPAALQLYAARDKTREQTAAMAAQRFVLANGRRSGLTLLGLPGHLRNRLFSFVPHPE